MHDVTKGNFGLLIAYVLPGLTVMWGLSHLSSTIKGWLGAMPESAPTVGGFLYATIASVGLGVTVSTIRWLIVDSLHHRTGLPQPNWDFGRLQENLAAYEMLVEIHYRYHQFHANMLVAIVIAAVVRWTAVGFRVSEFVMVLAIGTLFILGSRDTLRKYYLRGESVLRPKSRSRSNVGRSNAQHTSGPVDGEE